MASIASGMHAKFWLTTRKGQVLAAKAAMVAGSVVVEAVHPRYARLAANIAALHVCDKDGRKRHIDEGEAWLAALPFHYNGTMLRAEVIADPHDSS